MKWKIWFKLIPRRGVLTVLDTIYDLWKLDSWEDTRFYEAEDEIDATRQLEQELTREQMNRLHIFRINKVEE